MRFLRYVPAEVTARAKEIAEEMLKGTIQIDATFGEVAARVVDKTSIDTSCRTKVPTKECILFGETEIRLGAVEQLVEAVRTHQKYVFFIAENPKTCQDRLGTNGMEGNAERKSCVS
jgi:predicted secreted protein